MKMVTKHVDFREEDIAAGTLDAWELIQPLWFTVSIYDGLEQYEKDLAPFSRAQRLIFALFWYDAEVNNGGHEQFFANSTGIVWKDALEGLDLVGAKEMAANLRQVLALFGGSLPFDREERWKALDSLQERGEGDSFREMDDVYYEQEDLDQLLNDYVRQHPADFVLQGDYPYPQD